MNHALSLVSSLSIEAGLICLIAVLLMIDIVAGKLNRQIMPALSAAGLLAICFLIPRLWGKNAVLLNGAYRLDALALFFKSFFLASGFVIILMTREYMSQIKERSTEFYLLLVIAILGACTLASANDFLVLFISIEFLTIPLYVLSAYVKTDERATEAGGKYLIAGAFSSALMLYGISFLYGTVGSFSFTAARIYLESSVPVSVFFYFGFFLILAGIGFKVSAFPFQLWVPDVYEGAATPATCFLSVISKGAGIAALLRVLASVMVGIQVLWLPIMALAACGTLLYGNLGALPQIGGNMKRLLAYSSIGHAGYLFMGFAAGSAFGIQAVLYYLMAYGAANLTIFLALICTSNAVKSDAISSFRGLSVRSPLLAASFFIPLLSLAGVPPLAGFFGKFLLIQAVVEKGMLWLAFTGAALVGVSLFYYLSVLHVMYVEKPEHQTPIPVSAVPALSLVALMAIIIALGIFQSPLLHVIAQTFGAFG